MITAKVKTDAPFTLGYAVEFSDGTTCVFDDLTVAERFAARWNEMATNIAAVAAYDAGLDAKEEVPTADDYNAVVALAAMAKT